MAPYGPKMSIKSNLAKNNFKSIFLILKIVDEHSPPLPMGNITHYGFLKG